MSIVEKFMTMDYGPAPEDPREALAWLDRSGRRFVHYIGGAWQPPAAGEYFDTSDPSTGEKLASIAKVRRRTLTPRCEPHGRLCLPGRRSLRTLARATSTPSHARCKSIRAGWPFSRRWTMANRFVRAATSIFLSLRGTSTTTRAGRSCSIRNFRVTALAESLDKLFRGIFRY